MKPTMMRELDSGTYGLGGTKGNRGNYERPEKLVERSEGGGPGTIITITIVL